MSAEDDAPHTARLDRDRSARAPNQAERDGPETRSLDGLRPLEDERLPRPDSFAPSKRLQAERPLRRHFARSLGLAGLALLMTTAIGVWVETLIREALSLTAWQDWTVLIGLGLTALGLILWIINEWRGLLRLEHLGDLREQARAGQAGDDRAAKAAIDRLERLYGRDPRREWAFATYREAAAHKHDSIAALSEFEARVVSVADAEAATLVSGAVGRVAAGTAVSPFPLLDMIVTTVLDLRMTAAVARVYGVRPGALASTRLLRRALLAVISAGALEASDEAIGEILGVGLAGRLSGKAGTALANGLLTARLGLAVIDACRPIPWNVRPRPRARTLAADALRSSKTSSQAG